MVSGDNLHEMSKPIFRGKIFFMVNYWFCPESGKGLKKEKKRKKKKKKKKKKEKRFFCSEHVCHQNISRQIQ